MFIRKNAASEVAAEMEKALVSEAVEKETVPLTKIAEAANLLDKVAGLFDEAGLYKEAEMTTYLLERLAGKRKPKKKVKRNRKSKTVDKAVKGLTSEKMVENLAHKGWVFNADDENDLKLGITDPWSDWRQSPEYWRYCGKKELEKGNLRGAAECIDRARKLEDLEKYDTEANEADDVNFSLFNKKQEQTPEYWRNKARVYLEEGRKLEAKGMRHAAKGYFDKADFCEAKAEALEDKTKGIRRLYPKDLIDENEAEDINWLDGEPNWEKDEIEQDLAREGFDLEDWDESGEWEDEMGGWELG